MEREREMITRMRIIKTSLCETFTMCLTKSQYLLTHLSLSKTCGIDSVALPICWFTNEETDAENISGFPKIRQLTSRVKPGFDLRTTIAQMLIGEGKRNQICMMIKGLERKMGREKGGMKNPKRKRCHIFQERKERKNRADKNESCGEIEMGKSRQECF